MNRINAPLAFTAAAVIAVVLAIVSQSPSLIRSAFGTGMQSPMSDDMVREITERHDQEIGNYKDRFNGRSAFFKPRKRPAPPPPPVVRDDPDPKKSDTTAAEPSIKPAAPNYGGPTIIAIIGDIVWFFDGTIRHVDEEKDGITVVSTDPPRTATIEHAKPGYETGSYEVPIFDQWDPSVWKSAPFFSAADGEENRTTTDVPGLIDVESGDAADDLTQRLRSGAGEVEQPANAQGEFSRNESREDEQAEGEATGRPPITRPRGGRPGRGGSDPDDGDNR